MTTKGVRFNYLYRDWGNYKDFGEKDFTNPNNWSLEEITEKIKNRLISGQYFWPDECGIELFVFHRYNDWRYWYEFESLEEVEVQGGEETIDDFIEKLKPD